MTRPGRIGAPALFGFVSSISLVAGLWGERAPMGMHDPAFDSIPFANWIAAPDSASKIRWSAQVLPAQLSFHQRLFTAATAQVDGADLASRRGKGTLGMFVQFTDSAGASYQGHVSVDLSKVEEGVSGSNVTYSVRAFVTPGEYRVAMLLADSASGEHWSRTAKVSFAPLRHDPLSGSWSSLPTVAFVPSSDPPESWLLPALLGRLNLPVKSKSPVRIDVLVNLTPSGQHAGSERLRNQTLAALIPTMQVISQMQPSESTMNLTFLDLSRRRVAFQQNNLHDVDVDALKDALSQESTGTIDIQSLRDRGRSAAYFVKQVSHEIYSDAAVGTKRVLIILSGATSFDPGEDLRPIESGRPAECPVFYVRYQAPPPPRELQPFQPRGWRRPGAGGLRGIDGPAGQLHQEHTQVVDQLEKTLKPISPRLYDVATPEQMRKALGEIRESLQTL